MSHVRFLLSVIVLVLVGGSVWAQAPEIVLEHGHIFTGDTQGTWVEALAVRGGRVVAVGSDKALGAMAGAATIVVDLGGRTVIPGINDAHDHVGGAHFGVAAVMHRPPMSDPPLAEYAAAVQAAAAKAPKGAWIEAEVGPAVVKHPAETRAAMDAAGGDHPVMLEAWWGHGVLLNGNGLKKVGLTDAVTDPAGGHFDRDAAGHLTGLLEEEAGNEIRRRLASEPGVEASTAEYRQYVQRRLQQGVTSVQVMATNARLSQLKAMFVESGAPLRIRIMRFPMPREDARDHEQQGSGEEVLSPLVRVAGVKYVLDGTPIEELAYRTTDYPDRPGWRGRPDYSAEFIRAQLKEALTGKDQLMMHIVGDAMTDEVMDEMEKLAPAATWQPLRVRFEHGDGFTTPERMSRARKLGIVLAQPRPGRPWKALEAAGIPLAYGSDGGMAPWFMFSVMTDTKNPQAISRLDALRVLTSGPAYAEFAESNKGTLTPGMAADLAVLSQDPMTAGAETLPATRSVMTMVAGKMAWSEPGFADARTTP